MVNDRRFYISVIAILAILLVAFFFRFYQLDKIPPGLFPDEATHAIDAQEVLAGNITLYSPDEGSTGALWRHLLALNFALFGDTIYSLRAFAAAVGVIGVFLAYLVVRELTLLPPGVTDRKQRDWQREVTALTAALFLAVSPWHIGLSRVAFSATLMLLVQDFTFFSMWRALRSGRRIWFWIFGASLGLLFYNYLPAKLAPALLVLFFLLDWLIHRRKSFFIRYRQPLLLAFGVAFITMLPLLIFAAFNIQLLMERIALPGTQSVGLGSPLQGLVANLAAFGLWPSSWLGQWGVLFLGPLLSICFVAGTVAAVAQIKKSNYLFGLVWWLVMLLPSALAPEGVAPHLRRAIGAATITYGLGVLGLSTLVVALFWLLRRRTSTATGMVGVMVALGLVLALFTGLRTYQRYFVEWGRSEEARLEYHVYDLELADLMALESGSETIYLLPLDSTAGTVNPLLDTITFVYQGRAGYDFLPDDEEITPTRLTSATAGREQVRLLTWNVTKHTGADPKNLADYFLEKWGEWQGLDSYQYFDIDTYALPTEPVTFRPAELFPLDVDFEGQMVLTGAAFGPEIGAGQGGVVSAGGRVWAEMTWQKLVESPADYQVSVWLEDETGHPVGQVDKQLWSGSGHEPTSGWPVGSTERDYYLLRIDPTAAPGPYFLKVVLYDGATGQRLAPSLPETGAELAVTLGELTVFPATEPPDPQILDIPRRLDLPVMEGLRLLGFDIDLPKTIRPGDQATLWLWWQVVEPGSSLAVALDLNDDRRAWPLAEPKALDNDDWPVDSIIRTPVEVRVPAAVESGRYNLELRLLTGADREQPHEVLLDPVQVAVRDRNFTVPDMTRPVEANLGDQITLLGYDIDLSGMETTGVVKLVLVWQAQVEMLTPYQVFVHLVDGSAQIISQIDREPQAGTAPTTSWLPGEIIVDEIEVPVAENLELVTGIRVGLYNPANGERLVVMGGTGGTGGTEVELPLGR